MIVYRYYRDCVDYLKKHPEAEERFRAYLTFVKKFAERVAEDGGDLAVLSASTTTIAKRGASRLR